MRRGPAFHDQILAAVPLFCVFALMGFRTGMGPYDVQWPLLVVGFGAMLITPLALEVLRRQGMKIQVPTLVFIAAWSCMAISAGGHSWLWPMPWLLVTLWIAWQAAGQFLRGPRNLARTVSLSGPAMLVVGGAWYFADQSGLRPLNFDFLIVRLTAAHFHFAGFVLPVVAGLVLRYLPGKMVGLAALGVMGGVMMVATGITLTRMGVRVEAECCLALVFSLCALITGAAQVTLACRAPAQKVATRILLILSGLSLMAGMVFAILYALRPWVQLPWLQNMPRMWAWHGSIQAFGFALCGLAGWLGWRSADLARPGGAPNGS
jgi:hypothetical protein